jgi:hypothetical protein
MRKISHIAETQTAEKEDKGIKMRKEKNYTVTFILHNAIYAVMILLGAVIFLVGSSLSSWGVVLAILFILYGIAGVVWIMFFMCPACALFDSKDCPCGYGVLSAKFRNQQEQVDFNKLFKRHIWVVVPQWIIPVIAAIVYIIRDFSLLMFILLFLFSIQAFVILPLFSRHYGCKDCPQKDECTWMKKKEETSEDQQEEEDEGEDEEETEEEDSEDEEEDEE